jgi:hypothetical protein
MGLVRSWGKAMSKLRSHTAREFEVGQASMLWEKAVCVYEMMPEALKKKLWILSMQRVM